MKQERVEILKNVDNLIKDNCMSCSYFNKQDQRHKFCQEECKVGKELMSLGDNLLSTRKKRYRNMLAKGEDLTTKEIKKMLEVGIKPTEISKSTGMEINELRYMARTLNVDSKIIFSEEDVTKREWNLLRNKKFYIFLKLKELDKTDREIADFLGLSIFTIYSYQRFEEKRLILNIPLNDKFKKVDLGDFSRG